MKEIIKNLFGVVAGVVLGLFLTLKFWGDDLWQVIITVISGVIFGLIITNIKKLPDALSTARLKTMTIIAALSCKKERDILLVKEKVKLNLEDKIIISLVFIILITLVSFIGLIIFTLIKSNSSFSLKFNLDFILLIFCIEFVSFLLLAVFSLNGFKNNIKFIPKKWIKLLWLQDCSQFSLIETIESLELIKGRKVKIKSIVWRLLLTFYLSYVIFVLRLAINLLSRIFLFLIFLIIFPIFFLREITHLSYLLLAAISLLLAVSFLIYFQLSLGLIITLGSFIYLLGVFLNMVIKINLFTYLTKMIYKKIELSIFMS